MSSTTNRQLCHWTHTTVSCGYIYLYLQMKEKTNAEVIIKCMASSLIHNKYNREMSNGDSLHTSFMAPLLVELLSSRTELHASIFLFLKFSGEGISTGVITPYYLCSAPHPSPFIFPSAAWVVHLLKRLSLHMVCLVFIETSSRGQDERPAWDGCGSQCWQHIPLAVGSFLCGQPSLMVSAHTSIPPHPTPSFTAQSMHGPEGLIGSKKTVQNKEGKTLASHGDRRSTNTDTTRKTSDGGKCYLERQNDAVWSKAPLVFRFRKDQM